MKNPYANIPPAMWLLTITTLISRSGNMVLVFLPLYLTQKLGFNIIETGQIISFYGLGQIVGAYYGGIMTDKLGSIKVQVIGFLLVGTFYILLEFLSIKFAIMLCMFLIGIFTASIRPATSTTITKLCAPEIRIRAYSLNYQAVNLGATIGPAIGGMLANFSYLWIFRLDGIANIVAALALIKFFGKQSGHTTSQIEPNINSSNTPSIWHDTLFLIFLLLSALIGICFFQILNIYPLYLSNDYQLSTGEIGLTMAFNGFLIVIFQMTITNHLRKFNALRIVNIGGFLICLGYFILPFYTGFYYALLSMFIITIGEMLTIPFAFEIVTKISPVARRGQYLGLLTCAISSIPLLVTPNLMPFIYAKLGSTTLWFSMGFVAIVISIGFEFLSSTNFKSKLYITEPNIN